MKLCEEKGEISVCRNGERGRGSREGEANGQRDVWSGFSASSLPPAVPATRQSGTYLAHGSDLTCVRVLGLLCRPCCPREMRRGFEDKDGATAPGSTGDGLRDIKRLRENGTSKNKGMAWVKAKDERERESAIFEVDSRSRFFLESASASFGRSQWQTVDFRDRTS
jgi:hypothetical protein